MPATAVRTVASQPRPIPAAPSDAFPALDRLGVVASVKRGQTLFHEGDRAQFYFKVVTGAVRTCKLLADGRRHVVDFHLPGDFIGFDGEADYTTTAEAVTDATLVRYARRSVDSLAAEEPRIGRHLLTIACQGLSRAQQQMVLLGRKSAEERIASFLLTMLKRNGANGTLCLPMTRADIGDHLGLTLETVSRALTQLRRLGIIELKGSHDIVICNRAALEDAAEAA